MKRYRGTALALLVGIGLGVLATVPSHRLASDARLPAPSALSATVRALLTARMARHGQDLDELHRSIVVLSYERAAEIADRILSEPALAQPTSDDATQLNAGLPKRFFGLQSELRASAREVASAARSRDPDALSNAHGRLAASCAACHGVYLAGPHAGTTAMPVAPNPR